MAEYFRAPVGPGDIVWTYSGVRPLYDDGASSATAATRDYVIKLREEGGAAVVDVFGGKITTYRRLSEAVMAKLAGVFPAHGRGLDGAGAACRAGTSRWTAGPALARALAADFPFLDRRLGGAAGARLRHRGARRCWPGARTTRGPRRAASAGT